MEPGFDMNQILQAAQQMQAHLASAQQNLADAEVTGTAGGGLVVAKVSGQGELLDLTIDPKVIDASDTAECADTIADLVLAAVRDASNAVLALQQNQLGFADALGNIDLSGLGLPGGFPGGAPGGIPGGLPGFPGGLPGLPGFGAPGVSGYAEDDDDDDDFDDDEDDFDDDEDSEGGPDGLEDDEKGKG
ncbi:MAG TPA: YbaB/EbfC family nucleoid-associated protein [Trebonia sp.]|nr:YbaB/EbfC family nucleoid-associated protein [Trebonia sp.]